MVLKQSHRCNLTAGPTGVLLTLLAGRVFRVEQRAVRPLPERRPAKFRRANILSWSKVADARNSYAERPRYRPMAAAVIKGSPVAVDGGAAGDPSGLTPTLASHA